MMCVPGVQELLRWAFDPLKWCKMYLQSIFTHTQTHTVLLHSVMCIRIPHPPLRIKKERKKRLFSHLGITPLSSSNMCYSAFLMCVPAMICDAPPQWHARRSDMCTVQISTEGFLWRERMVGPYLSAPLLTVNMKLLFSKHSSGEGNPCVIEFVQRGEMQSKSTDGRGWEWRQTTHHLIMLECATALCIFLVALVIGVVFVQTVRTERAFPGGKIGTTVWQRGRRKMTLCWVLRFVKSQIKFSSVKIKVRFLCAAEACEIWEHFWDHLKFEPVEVWPLCILALDLNVSFWLNPIVDSPAKYWVCYFCSF